MSIVNWIAGAFTDLDVLLVGNLWTTRWRLRWLHDRLCEQS